MNNKTVSLLFSSSCGKHTYMWLQQEALSSLDLHNKETVQPSPHKHRVIQYRFRCNKRCQAHKREIQINFVRNSEANVIIFVLMQNRCGKLIKQFIIRLDKCFHRGEIKLNLSMNIHDEEWVLKRGILLKQKL